ncbi:MAG: CDP-alcohol phosphatidyltransferase family protein [Lachnospiraceae bacterium]|nr:CDP-alcohol phosphatidyltransferase family protein [Lachnospiraceae bacterium]
MDELMHREETVVEDDRQPVDTDEFFTLPNILSIIRIFLIPVFMYYYIARGDYVLTAVLVIVSALTDLADGFIARRFHLVSAAGKVIDPIADKLTQLAVMLCLVTRYPHMIFPIIWIFLKELTTGIVSLIVLKKKGVIRGAAWHGKLNTVLLFLMMIMHLLWINIPAKVSDVSIFTCLGVMILSFIFYMIRLTRILKYA